MKATLAERFDKFSVTDRTRHFLAQAKGHFIATRWITDSHQTDVLGPVSGFGKDLGPEQLDQYLVTKAIWIEL